MRPRLILISFCWAPTTRTRTRCEIAMLRASIVSYAVCDVSYYPIQWITIRECVHVRVNIRAPCVCIAYRSGVDNFERTRQVIWQHGSTCYLAAGKRVIDAACACCLCCADWLLLIYNSNCYRCGFWFQSQSYLYYWMISAGFKLSFKNTMGSRYAAVVVDLRHAFSTPTPNQHLFRMFRNTRCDVVLRNLNFPACAHISRFEMITNANHLHWVEVDP